MTNVLALSSALQELAEPWAPGDRIKAAIARAAKRAGLSYWRAFDIWYRKARRIDAAEFDAIVEALAQKRSEANRNDFHSLRVQMARLEAMLSQRDPEFDRSSPDAIRNELRGMGGAGSTVARSRDHQSAVASSNGRAGR